MKYKALKKEYYVEYNVLRIKNRFNAFYTLLYLVANFFYLCIFNF